MSPRVRRDDAARSPRAGSARAARRSLQRRATTALGVVGGLVVAVAGVVMAGWRLGIPALVQIRPEFAPMQFNTALGFLLLGIGLVCAARGWGVTRRVVGCLAAALGGVSLIEYGLGIDVLDRLLQEPYIVAGTSHAGRMAPNTAVGFALAGVAMGLARPMVERGLRAPATIVLASVVVALGAVALAGYAAGVEVAYGWGDFTRMALHTALCFVTVGCALSLWICAGAVGPLTTRLLPMAVVTTGAVAAIFVAHALYAQEWVHLERRLDANTDQVAREFAEAVGRPLRALRRMSDRWRVRGGTPRAEWVAEAAAYARDESGLLLIQRLGDRGENPWTQAQSSAVATDLPARVRPLLGDARSGTGVVVSRAVEVTPGQYGFVAFVSLDADHRADGVLAAVYGLDALIGAVVEKVRAEGYAVEILDGGRSMLGGAPHPRDGLLPDRSFTWQVGDTRWKVRIWPGVGLVPSPWSGVGIVNSASVGLIAMLIAVALVYADRARRRERATRGTNRALRVEVVKRRTAQAALAAAYRQTDLILHAAGEGIYGLGVDGCTTFVNQATASMLGWGRDDLVGNVQHDLVHHSHPDGTPYPLHACRIHVALARGEVLHVDDDVFWRKDGSCFPVEYTSTPMRDDAGRLVGAVVIFKDVTERKRAEQQLRGLNATLEERVAERTALAEQRAAALLRANEDLRHSNQDLDDFAYIASHDLKEPLRGISNYARFLEEDYGGNLGEDAHAKIRTVIRLSERLASFIDALFMFSRVGRADLAVEEVDLSALVADVLQQLEVTVQGVDVVVEIPPSLARVRCDRLRVGEVFANLVTNAAKYNDKPERRIEIGARRAGVGAAPPVFFVRDNGIGIRDKHRETVFRIFKRLHGRDAFGGGTGAGLTIVKKIVERHGGRIWITSTVDEGTTMHFTLAEDTGCAGGHAEDVAAGGEHDREQLRAADSVG
jgi:PAS domain S-box-containing protein